MVILDQFISALIGTLVLVVGVRAIVTRQIEVGETDRLWLYGWRAVVAGCVLLLTAVFCFAGAAKLIHIRWLSWL